MNETMSSTKPIKPKIFLFGGGMHCLSCIDVIEQQDKFQIAGIIDSMKDIGSSYEDYPILGRIESLPDLIQQYNVKAGFVCLGDNWQRKKLAEEVLSITPSFDFVNLIHPRAVFGRNVSLGKGIFVGAQSLISPSVTVGDFCLIHQRAHLGLRCTMEEASSISAGSIAGGRVTIGVGAAITLGAIINERITIGSYSVVGSGAVVCKDIPDYVVAYGTPAKVIRSRTPEDLYLKLG